MRVHSSCTTHSKSVRWFGNLHLQPVRSRLAGRTTRRRVSTATLSEISIDGTVGVLRRGRASHSRLPAAQARSISIDRVAIWAHWHLSKASLPSGLGAPRSPLPAGSDNLLSCRCNPPTNWSLRTPAPTTRAKLSNLFHPTWTIVIIKTRNLQWWSIHLNLLTHVTAPTTDVWVASQSLPTPAMTGFKLESEVKITMYLATREAWPAPWTRLQKKGNVNKK